MARILEPNLASDPDARKIVEDELLPLVRHIRRNRRTIRETWLRYWRIYTATRDQQSYQGRSQTYIAIGRKMIENWTNRICRDLFPHDEWFGIKAKRQSDERRVPALKALFHQYFTAYAKVRKQSKPYVRQMVTLGTSPVKIVWRVDEREIPVRREILDPDGNPTKRFQTNLEQVISYLGPTFRPVDTFSFYVWPETVDDVDDASVVMEDLLVSPERVAAMGKVPVNPDDPALGMLYENVDEFFEHLRSNDSREKVDAEARRLQDRGFTHPIDMNLPDHMKPADITDILWRKDLDGDGRAERLLVTFGADLVPLRIQQNPFWHGMCPWRVGRFVEVDNEFYGYGLPSFFDRQQYWLNDIADQATDALTWCMNPIAVVDMYDVQDPTSIRMRPGAKWLAKTSAVQFTEPPKETPAMGFSAVGQLMTLIQGMVDVAPLPSVGQARSRGKATQSTAGMQMAMVEAAVPIRDVVENLEDTVYSPLLYMAYTLTQQCLDRSVILQVAGAEGATLIEQKVTVQDIVGDFEFTWLGSVSAMNQQIRAQQMLNFMQVMGQMPPEQLQANNIRIRWDRLIRAYYREGLGLPNAEQIIEDIQKQTSIDPHIENDLFRLDRGREVTVSEADKDDEHIVIHQPLLMDIRLNDQQRKLVQAHQQMHQAAKIAKQIMQMQQQAQQQGLANAAKPQPGLMGGGVGNGSRMPSTQDMGDLFRQAPRGPMT